MRIGRRKTMFSAIITAEHTTPDMDTSLTLSSPRAKFRSSWLRPPRANISRRNAGYSLRSGKNPKIRFAQTSPEKSRTETAYRARLMETTPSREFLLSKRNIVVESAMFSVRTGMKRLTVTEYRSYVPYSAEVRTLVYRGTRKKLSSFVPNCPTVRNSMFFAR